MGGSTEGFVRGNSCLAAPKRSRIVFFPPHTAVWWVGHWLVEILGAGCADVRLGYAPDPKAAWVCSRTACSGIWYCRTRGGGDVGVCRDGDGGWPSDRAALVWRRDCATSEWVAGGGDASAVTDRGLYLGGLQRNPAGAHSVCGVSDARILQRPTQLEIGEPDKRCAGDRGGACLQRRDGHDGIKYLSAHAASATCWWADVILAAPVWDGSSNHDFPLLDPDAEILQVVFAYDGFSAGGGELSDDAYF